MLSKLCVLSKLDSLQWKSIDRVLIIRCSEISPFNFLYIVIEFEDVYYVKWSEYFVTVRFLSKKQIDRCFNAFAMKEFEVMITAVSAFFIRKLLWVKLYTEAFSSHSWYSDSWIKIEWRWCWIADNAAEDKQGKKERRGRTKCRKWVHKAKWDNKMTDFL